MGLFDSIRRVVGGGQPASDDASTDEDDQPDLVDTRDLGEENLRERAEGVAGEVEQLDFSLDSLEQFDAAIDAGYDDVLATPDEPGMYDRDVVRFGCYLGEVLLRVYDGEWTRDSEWGVTITGPDDTVTVSVFDVATRSIQTGAVFAAVTDRAAVEVGYDDGPPMQPSHSTGEADDADAETAVDADDADAETAVDADDADAETAVDADDADAETGTDSAESAADTGADAAETASGADEPHPNAADSAARDPEADTDDDTAVQPDDFTAPSDTDDDTAVQPDDFTAPSDTDDGLASSDSGADPETGAEGTAASDDGDEVAISEVAESEFGFEFETAGDEVTATPLSESDGDESETATARGDDEAGTEAGAVDSATDASGGALDGVATPDEVDADDPATTDEVDGDAVETLVEEAEPDEESPTPEGEATSSLLDAAEEAETDGESSSDPTAGDGLRAEYAAEAEGFVSFWNEHDLDYSPASLDELDSLVATEWDDDRFDDATFGSGETFEDRAFTSVSTELGSYFGEVLVRVLDGEWSDETVTDSVVVEGPDGPLAIPVFRVAGTSLREAPVFARSYASLLSDLQRDA